MHFDTSNRQVRKISKFHENAGTDTNVSPRTVTRAMHTDLRVKLNLRTLTRFLIPATKLEDSR